jgi:hypothetical protein
MENVITTEGGSFCGFPFGEKTHEEWKRQLVEEFNNGLSPGTQKATNAVGWVNDRVEFIDVAEIAMRLFDLRKGKRN